MYWRYDLDTNQSQLLKDQTVTSGQEAITINLLELLWHGNDSVCDPSHLARQTRNQGRASAVERRQCYRRVVG